jgi:DNA-binding SARP family transcriptional activator
MTVMAAQQPEFTLNLLGRFELRREGRVVRATPATQRLLAFVATRTVTVTVGRTVTAQTRWPDTCDVRAAANLRLTLWRLRHEQDGPVRCRANGLDLGPDTTVDLHAVHARTAVLDAAADHGEDEAGHLKPEVLRHDVLPDWSDEWLLTTHEWFHQVRLHALEALCVRHCRRGRFNAALEVGLAAIACEPLRESAHRAVVGGHLAEGNPAEALRQYQMYRRLLDTELGLPPPQQFRALIAHGPRGYGLFKNKEDGRLRVVFGGRLTAWGCSRRCDATRGKRVPCRTNAPTSRSRPRRGCWLALTEPSTWRAGCGRC